MPVDPVDLDRPGVIRAEYVQRSGSRYAGWGLFAITAPLGVLGGVGGTIGWMQGDIPGVLLGSLALIAGGVCLVLALALGLPLAALGDSVEIAFE